MGVMPVPPEGCMMHSDYPIFGVITDRKNLPAIMPTFSTLPSSQLYLGMGPFISRVSPGFKL